VLVRAPSVKGGAGGFGPPPAHPAGGGASGGDPFCRGLAGRGLLCALGQGDSPGPFAVGHVEGRRARCSPKRVGCCNKPTNSANGVGFELVGFGLAGGCKGRGLREASRGKLGYGGGHVGQGFMGYWGILGGPKAGRPCLPASPRRPGFGVVRLGPADVGTGGGRGRTGLSLSGGRARAIRRCSQGRACFV